VQIVWFGGVIVGLEFKPRWQTSGLKIAELSFSVAFQSNGFGQAADTLTQPSMLLHMLLIFHHH